MPDLGSSSRLIRFGLFETDLGAGELRKNGSKIKLQDRPFEILTILLERPGQLVTREEFRQRLWPADTFVDFDHSLNASINKLRQALDDSAENPRFVATVGRRGYRFIAPVGPPSVPDPALASPPVHAADDSFPPTGTKQRNLLHHRSSQILVGVLAIASLLGCWIWITGRWPGRRWIRTREGGGDGGASPTPVKLRRSFAVFGLRNLAGKADESWLSTALAEMLSTELAAGEQMRVVSGEGVARAKLDLGISDTDSYAPETLARLRKNLGSDYVIAGTYLALGDKTGGEVRVDLRLQDAMNGETIAVVSETGNEAHLPDLVSRAGLRLRQRLGLAETTTADALSVRASLPGNPEAARLYAEGLAKLRVFDALAARDLLQEAVALEPKYSLLHSALASAWTVLGYDNKAREEAQRAFGLSAKLPREERLVVEGSYCETIRDWAKAVEIYRTLFLLFPDNLDYGLHLVRAQISRSNAREAQATLEALRKLPPTLSEDPRIDLVEVDVAAFLSDYKRELASAQRAASKGAGQGSRLVVAQARLEQGLALAYLGENTRALASLTEAKETFAAVGDRAKTAQVLLYLAGTTFEQGDYNQSLQLFREALALNREIGHKAGMGTDLNNMAVQFENQRDFLTAQKMYEQALAIYREIGDKRRENVALGNVAEVLFYRGNLAAAGSRYQQALDAFHAMGDSSGEASQLKGMAMLFEVRGELRGAQSKFEQAVSIWRANGYLHPAAEAMVGLGEVQLAQGDIAGARKTQEEALAVRQKLGEKESIAESQLALATVWLEEGRSREAEHAARQALAEFRAENVPDLEAAASTVLARALMQQGKSAEAQDAAEAAMSFSAKSQEPMIRLSVAINAARIRKASSGRSTFQKRSVGLIIHDLEVVIAQAKKSGFLGLEFEAKLALGEAELGTARSTRGLALLASVEREARAEGFGLIARKAATAQK